MYFNICLKKARGFFIAPHNIRFSNIVYQVEEREGEIVGFYNHKKYDYR